MIDADLLDELNDSASKTGYIRRLETDEVMLVMKEVADKFIDDTSCLYWWASLKVSNRKISYEERDGLFILNDAIYHLGKVYFVVTDDEAGPWPVYIAEAGQIALILRNCRYFEYFVVAQDFSGILFDTHLNEFVYAGSINLECSSI